MQKAWLVLFLFASVYAESVRETETWMPMKPQADDSQDLVSSGDRPGSDFGFEDEDDDLDADDDDDNYDDLDTMYDDYDDEDYDDEDDDDSFSGSGDEESTDVNTVPIKPDLIDNKIPDQDKPVRPKPTSNDIEAVINNEVGLRVGEMSEEGPGNVLMTQAQNENILGKPEVLAALIAGGAVGLLFAILLILLLIYRMKKKDEGSYDLGKKPIYTKAPTTEIYA